MELPEAQSMSVLKRMDARHQGRTYPLGAHRVDSGVNFSLYSKNATGVELLLFDDVDARRPERVITLDQELNRTGHYWHCHVDGLEEGQLYGYRVHGPYKPERGLLFDGQKVLLDP
jgi:glycogen operon protein